MGTVGACLADICHTYAVQVAVLCSSTDILSAERCGSITEGCKRLAFWLQSIRFLRGLCDIFAVSCGCPRL